MLYSLTLLYPKNCTNPIINKYNPAKVKVSLNKPEPQKITDGIKNIAQPTWVRLSAV